MNKDQAKHRAAAFTRRESLIDAPVRLVWSILADIQGWPRWNPEVKEVNLNGEVKPGHNGRIVRRPDRPVACRENAKNPG